MLRRAAPCALALLCACATSQPAGVSQTDVNRIVGQVLTAQSRIGTGEKLDALAELEAFLTTTPHRSERVANALEQLAGLYLQIEIRTYRNELARYQRNGGGIKPQMSHDRSIALYRKWLADYPERATSQRIYYQLARAYEDLGDTEREIAMLGILVAQDPPGPFHDEARFRLAELAFADARFEQAAERYGEVLHGDAAPGFRDYAGYKRAWAYYLAEQNAEAARAAVDFIDLKRVPRGKAMVLDSTMMPEPDWERVREVMKILARALNRLGGVAVLEKMVPADRDYADMVYRELAEAQAQVGRRDEAIATYEAYVRRHPTAVQTPAVLGYMVDTHTEAGDEKAAVATRVRLVTDFGTGSPWWNAQDAATRRATLPALRQTTHRLARYFHSAAQASKQPADYQTAADWYRRYLSTYPDARDTGEVAFLLGEVLFEAGQHAEAADAYADAAYRLPPHSKAGEAAYAAVLARERHLAQARPGGPEHARRLTALNDAMIDLVKAHPREPRLMAAFERLTGILFEADAHDELYRLADTVIRDGPRVRALHILAWRVLGEAALRTGRTARAEEALAQALDYVQDDPVQSAEIRKLMAAAAVSAAAQAAPEESAAALARAAGLLDPSDPLAEPVRADAALAPLQGDDPESALPALGAFLENYPESAHRERIATALLATGENTLADGDPGRAMRLWGAYRQWFGGAWPERDLRLARLEGKAHLDAGELDAADAAFSRVLAAYPGAAPEEDVDRLAGIRYKRAVAAVAAGNPEGLDLLAGIADGLPGSVLAPAALEALVNAAGGMGQPERAARAAQRLAEDFPGTPQAEQVDARMVPLLLAAGRPGDAAARLLADAAALPDDTAVPLILRAVELYEEADATDRAIGALMTLRDRFEAGSDRWAEAYVDTVRLEEAGTRNLPERPAAPDLNDRVDARVLEVFTPLAEADRLGAEGRAIAGRIWRHRAEAARAAFERVRLVPPLKENLTAKTDALKAALKAFDAVQGFRAQDSTVNASLQMGEMFDAFATEMLASPVPAELNAAQAEFYRQGLEQKAAPYRERAVRAWLANLERLRDGVAGPDVERTLERLARARPEWYDRPEIGAVLTHVP